MIRLSEEVSALAVAFQPTSPVTDDEIRELSRRNPLHRFERTAQGELVVAPPTGTRGGEAEGELYLQVALWNRTTGRGRAYPASAGFVLPNGALRAPDAAWISHERWNALRPEERERTYARVCPEAAFELLSPDDRLGDTRAKLREYVENGARLAVLLNPRDRSVEIARPSREIERVADPHALTFEDELPGFTLDVARVFDIALGTG
jgi:Uma2 family endonuclease